MKKVSIMLLVTLSFLSALFAEEKSWIVQKWLGNCNNRVQNGLNFAFGPLIYKRWNFSETEINQDCQTTLHEILERYTVKKEISYSVRYFLDNGVEVKEEIRHEVQKGLEDRIKKFFAPVIGEVNVKNKTDQGAIDMSFLVYLSKFPVNDIPVWYGRVEGNFYFNYLYNIEYPVGVAYDGRVDLAGGLSNDFEVIIQDYAIALREVLDKNFAKKYLP